MNDNTKLRIKVSKRLFESIAKEVLAEAKGGDYAMRETKKMMKPKKGGTKKLEEMDKMKQPKMEMATPEVEPLKEYTHIDPSSPLTIITSILGLLLGGGITATILMGLIKDFGGLKKVKQSPEEFAAKANQELADKAGDTSAKVDDKL